MKIVLSLLCVLPLAAVAQTPLPSSKRIADAAARYWNRQLERDPVLRVRQGLEVTRLPDPSERRAVEAAAFSRQLLADLARIDTRDVPHQDMLTLAQLRWNCQNDIAFEKYIWLRPVVTPYDSSLAPVQRVFNGWQFKNVASAAAYLKLLAQYPDFIRGLQKLSVAQLERHVVLPKAEIAQVETFLSAYSRPADKSPFRVDAARLKALKPDEAARFQSDLNALIDSRVVPAVKDLAAFLDGPYQAKAPDAVGLGQYPNGKDYYRFLIGYYTTIDNLTPEAVHEKGLREVERINERMAAIRKQLGFTGTKAEFHQFLQKDPRFALKTPDAVADKLMSHVRRIEPYLDKSFRLKPKAPYGVKRLDPALEAVQTFGFYETPTAAQPMGYYNFNGSNLENRSWANAEALIFHELVPGHHFQIALQRENPSLPEFRREAFYSANSEGWAEYASSLGEEFGLFTDPYDLYGRLGMDMFISVRLVVDTGMNYFGWSRDRATKFMLDNALETPLQIATETLRYSTDLPGQALGYKMGSLKFRQLREKASAALGDRFDLRDFHDWVLESGSMPLSILESHIDYQIARAKAAKSGSR